MDIISDQVSMATSRFTAIPVLALERFCCWLVFVTGFFGVALFPIDVGPFTLFPFRIFLLVIWILFIIRILVSGKVILPLNEIRLYLLFLGLWLVYAILSLGWTAEKVEALRHILFLFMGGSVIFFTTYYFHEERDLKRLFWLWVGAFAVLLLIGLWEHLTGRHLPVSGYHEEKLSLLRDYVRVQVMYWPTGVFKNPNDYATFLALSIPFTLGVFRYVKSVTIRLAGLSSAVLAFYFIVITGSRANMLTVLLELTVILVFLTSINQKAKVIIAGVACVATALFFLPAPFWKFFSGFIGQLGSILEQAEFSTGSAAIRMNLMRNGLLFLYSTAGFGVGAGNAEYWMANFARYDTAGILNPHNWWLEILINYGIFIFVGYIAFYVRLLFNLWRGWCRAKDRTERMIVEAIMVALVGFAIASISSSSIMAFHPQWLLFALGLSVLKCIRKEVKIQN
jgi:teichuronic acid biosynthesis protein TuaE